MKRKEDFDWLEDPFNDKKSQDQGGMGSGAKAALGCGCLLAVIGIIVLLVFAGMSMLDILS